MFTIETSYPHVIRTRISSEGLERANQLLQTRRLGIRKPSGSRQTSLLAGGHTQAPRLPAAERAGITKRIGWHSFRRTLATLLQSSEASVKTTQELLRHASPGITMGIYAKAVTADKRHAQDAIAALFVGNSNQSADAVTA